MCYKPVFQIKKIKKKNMQGTRPPLKSEVHMCNTVLRGKMKMKLLHRTEAFKVDTDLTPDLKVG